MKVIFIKDLKGKGKINDIKDFSDGYAINYLIKNKYAVKYTETSSKRLTNDLNNLKEKEEQDICEANELKNKLNNLTLRFYAKTGKEGKIFGSVSNKQIADELFLIGYKIDKRNIKIDVPINSLGVHLVKIELHKKVNLELKIELLEK